MDMLGKIDLDKLDAIKAELFEKGSDPLMSDAYQMIRELENTIVTMTLNHNQYVQWAVEQIQKLQKRNSDLSWTVNPDTSGGAFTQDEIDRSRNGGW